VNFNFSLNKRIILGTAQFGSLYGVANKNKASINKKDCIKILNFCKKNKIRHIETARNYNNSEKKLGESGIHNFNIITKIPKLNLRLSNFKIAKQINNYYLQSCSNLRTKKIYALLLHRGEQLLSKKGDIIYNSLLMLKKQKLVSKIGISVHDPMCLKKIIKKYQLDIVQVSFNILDNRIYNLNIVNFLKEKNVKIYCRSIFLQGLLLMKSYKIKMHLRKHLQSFFLNTADKLKNKLNLCLSHVFSHKEIDKLIIGIDNLDQLKEISKILKILTLKKYTHYQTNNLKIIDPLKW
jgi:aryl-alcohol dehydrogenase-like predicted oxidoreductase